MGPNGSGKSTLSSVIAGKEDYEVEEGTIEYQGEDLLELDQKKELTRVFFFHFNIQLKFLGFLFQTLSKRLYLKKEKL